MAATPAKMVMQKFAVHATDVDVVASHLQRVIGTPFERRDSSYLGSYDLFKVGADGQVQIVYNRDPMFLDGDPPEEWFFEHAFRDHGVLVFAWLPDDGLMARLQQSLTDGFPDTQPIPRRPPVAE